jgi:hypothetical protein
MASQDNLDTTSRVALQSLLKSTAPTTLQKALLEALPRMTAAQFNALSDILSPLAATASVAKHCMRCHKTFYENRNHAKACAIKHSEAEEGERARIGDDAILFTLSCCDESFEDDEGPAEEILLYDGSYDQL